MLGKPVEEQQQRIDLIVVSAVRKREELALEIGKPRCLVREQDATRFETPLLTAHPRLLVGIRPAADDIETCLLLQQLDQPHAAAGILDDDEVNLPLRRERDDLLAHLHDRPMATADLEHMQRLLLHPCNDDRGIIVVDAGLAGRVAAQHDALETVALRRHVVTPEPGCLDHVAVGWCRVLLVLSGEDPAADLAFQLVDRLGAVSRRLQ